MKKSIRHSLIAATLLLSHSAMADISSSKAQQLIDAAGIAESQAAMQESLLNDIGADITDSFNEKERKKAKKILIDEFANADISNKMQSRFENELNDTDAEFVLAFLESNLGKRINAMEQAGQAIDSDLASKKGEALLNDNQLDTFTEQLDDAIGASDLAFNLAKPIFAVMLNTKLEAHGVNDDSLNLGRMFFDEMVKEAEPIVIQETRKVLAYTYRDLTQEERDSFLNFLQDPRSHAFTRILLEETKQGTLTVFKTWLVKIGKLNV